MAHCYLCPVRCGADREKRAGYCGVRGLTVAKYYLHPFEEPPISHRKGSGTVFFGGCSLRCAFCQNYELSRASRGKPVSPHELSEIFFKLEEMGAENINLVTPDHVSPLIASALSLRRPNIPVVYNSSGYCLLPALEEIAPYVDIWLPDVKFFSPALSQRYTGRTDYFEHALRAAEYMAKKPLLFEETGKMMTGIILRHLVLPGCTSDSLQVLKELSRVLPKGTPLSLMRQYTPMGEAERFPELQRTVTAREYRRVTDGAFALGFTHIYTQGKESADTSFTPQWDF